MGRSDTAINRDFSDGSLYGSVVEGRVETWKDFADGDQLQVRVNGVTYLTHSANVVMMSGGN